MAASPRAKTDMDFRSQLIDYFAECAVVKDLDPQQDMLQAQMTAFTAALQRIPMPNGPWRVAGPFWEYAAMFKKQMETTYRLLAQQGVLAIEMIAPSHGVIWRSYVGDIVGSYVNWSKGVAKNKVTIVYDTMHGSTDAMSRVSTSV